MQTDNQFSRREMQPSSLLAPAHIRTQALCCETFDLPPLDGSLTVPEMYDWHMLHSSEHPLFQFSDDGQLKVIKWSEAVQAIQRMSRKIKDNVESIPEINAKEGQKKIIAILSNTDLITYFTIIMGVLRAGYICFPISPRNTPSAIAHLLSKSSASHIIVGREQFFQDLVKAALVYYKKNNDGLSEPSLSSTPLFKDLYIKTSEITSSFYDLPPYSKPELDETCLLMHSSGTSGHPKIVRWTHRFYLDIVVGIQLGENDMCGMRIGAQAVPMFHTMGTFLIAWAASAGLIICAFKPQSPATIPSPVSLIEEVIASESDFVFCTPTFIEAWFRVPGYVDHLATLQGVFFGGAPLDKSVGDSLISKGVKLSTMYGRFLLYVMVEKGKIKENSDNREDWEYVLIEPIVEHVFVPRGDGHFELLLLSNKYRKTLIINTRHEDKDAYATADLFEPHPTKSGLWKFVGRADSIILHITGEKTNPIPLESILNQDSHIKSSVMFGQGQFQAGVLIDPKSEYQFDPADSAKLVEFRNKIWPTVENMNNFAPQQSRIFKEMILVASPSKPIAYTLKNTPTRTAVINEYAVEIDALYKSVEETTQANIDPPSSWTSRETLEFVKRIVHTTLKKDIDDQADIFENGCDSLQSTWIRNSLFRALRESAEIETRTLPTNFVYQYPSILQLTEFMLKVVNGINISQSVEERVEEMHAMLTKYTQHFPDHNPSISASETCVILLTGSTGGLGSHLLVQLFQRPEISRIYLLNRVSRNNHDLKSRQRKVLQEKGLPIGLLESEKVVMLKGELSKVDFDLPHDVYENLRTEVTHIIHNAWRVDFNVSLSSFESNIRGLHNLIEFALSSPLPTPPRLLFTSSVSVFRRNKECLLSSPLREVSIDAEVAVGSGYSESKWISEKMMEVAQAKTSLRPITVRIGQLSGGSNGAWNESEWVPAILRSASHLKCLPVSNELIAWLPIDVAASAIVDFLDSSESILHLAHPKPVPWCDIFTPLSDLLHVPLVPYTDWLERLKTCLEDTSKSEADLMQKVPALKLLDFFKEIGSNASDNAGIKEPLLGMENALKASPTLSDSNLARLGFEDARRWLAHLQML